MKLRFNARLLTVTATVAAVALWAQAATGAESAPPAAPASQAITLGELDAQGLHLFSVAISVRDIERSIRFYEALGFKAGKPSPVRPAIAKLIDRHGGGKSAKFEARLAVIQRDGVTFELLQFTSPRVERPASHGVADQLGLSSIALRVNDVERVATIIQANGGSVFKALRLTTPGRDILLCADPDGTRIELVRAD